MTHKLYEQLGLSKGASKEDIKKAYRKTAMQCHPDKGGDPEQFKEVSRAYQILSDDEKRSQYDQLGDEHYRENGPDGGPGHGFDPRDIFAQFFGGGGMGGPGFDFHFGGGGHPFGGHGGGPPRPQKCGDHRHVWQISMRDAYFGVDKILKVSVQKPCRACVETCYACQGRGMITQMTRMGMFTQMSTRPCNECNGAGKAVKGKASCGQCQGKGMIPTEHRVELKAPKGVQTGHHIRIPQFGEQSMERDDLSGDLIIEVLVQNHPLFQRRGNDLYMEVTIPFINTILGTKYVIPHFEGDVEVNTEDFGIIQHGKEYSVPKKGFQEGNLVIKFTVEYPKNKLSSDQIEMLKGPLRSIPWVYS